MKRSLRFVGPLADHFGRDPICFDFDDIAQMFSGLECAFPNFKAVLDQFNEFAFLRGKGDTFHSIPENELAFGFGKSETIVMSAGVAGSAETAAVYVAEALATYGVSYAVAYAITYIAVTIAIAYASSAVMASLSKGPGTDKEGEREKFGSALYNGAHNVIEQGGPIPLVYGRHRVGGQIMSSELTTARIGRLLPDTYSIRGGDELHKNVTDNDILRDQLTLTSWTIGGVERAMGYTYSGSDYTVTLSATGDLVIVTTDTTATQEFDFTYAASNTDGTTATTTVRVEIMSLAAWNALNPGNPGY